MDYNFKEKLKDESITIAILYDSNNYKDAMLLEKKIYARYHNKIENYTIKTLLLTYDEIDSTNANLYYLFPTTTKNIKNVINKAQQSKALTFSYSNNDLKEGIMLSLKVGTKVKPIINLTAAKTNHITFRPVLLKISHIYTVDFKTVPNSSIGDSSYICTLNLMVKYKTI